MKYRNLFYTRAFKSVILIFITVLTWVTSGYVTEMFHMQVTNRAAVKNVFTQPFSFDYETSEYLQQEIETTIDSVLDYSLNYSKNFIPDADSSYEEYDYYMRLSNVGYRKTVEYLESLKGVNFAVVNHSTDKIISNIREIHGASSGTETGTLFRSSNHPFIIIYNCRKPYYEQESLSDYVEHVRKKASEYSDNCDLYISFTEGLCFRETLAYYENMHSEYSDKVFSLSQKIIIFSLASTLLVSLLVKVCGKAEKDGKAIPSLSDRLPTDLILIFELMIIACAIALYHTSLYMIYKTSTIEEYGIGFSSELYALRADITLVIAVHLLCAMLCKIKRQKSLGTLYSGSYICMIAKLLSKNKKNVA